MLHPLRSALIAGVVVTSIVAGLATATPPEPGTEPNGLTDNESATLWSRDSDAYTSQAAYRQRYGETRSAVQQVANGTDITFTRPPATAATWTRNDFDDLDAGEADTSVHPPHAELEDGVFIADAHATIFAVQPSTRTHLEPGRTPLYVAPNGTLRGFVDYRVRVPNGSTTANTTTEWTLVDHRIEAVRVKSDGQPIAESPGTHTPALEYRLDEEWRTTLTLEAEISVRLKKTVQSDETNHTDVTVTYRTESRTVTDSITVEVYDLAAYPYYAAYPNGETGVAIFQTRPWQGYTLSADGETRVRGVWRFYTARTPEWDTLVRSTQRGETTVESDALPVYVHAYPSRIGPRTEPVREGPALLKTWGTPQPSPAGTLGEKIAVDVVTDSYTPTDGIAVRADTVDRDALQVRGIVRGANASIVEPPNGSERRLRRSNLTLSVIQHNQSQATLKVGLRDERTGEPIALDGSRQYPVTRSARTGVITVADQRVETNASGVAIVTVDAPGIYTARYRPGSWLGHEPAYVGDSATTRWHPLRTIDGWFVFMIEVGWQLIPFVVMFYAGTRLLRLLGPNEMFNRK
jgi:hypothetical protein